LRTISLFCSEELECLFPRAATKKIYQKTISGTVQVVHKLRIIVGAENVAFADYAENRRPVSEKLLLKFLTLPHRWFTMTRNGGDPERDSCLLTMKIFPKLSVSSGFLVAGIIVGISIYVN